MQTYNRYTHLTQVPSELVKSHALSYVSRSSKNHLFHTNHQSHTKLDLFITINRSISPLFQSSSPFIAVYDFIELAIHFRSSRPPCSVIESRRLQRSNPTDIKSLLMLDLSTDKLAEKITSTFDTLAPLTTSLIPSKHKSWVSPQMHSLMSERDKAYDKIQRFQ